MALSDYVPAKRPVSYRGKTLIEVRGLSLEDVTLLMRNHVADLRALYDLWDADNRKLLPDSQVQIDNLMFTLLTMFPDTAARMIAMAADEPGETENARRLPMPLQIQILGEIVEQTFEDVGGPLVFATLLKMRFRQMTEVATTQSTSSTVN